MGFAVRADQSKGNSVESSRKRNLVLLHPVKKSSSSVPRELFEAPVQAVPAPAEVSQLPASPRLPLGLKLLVGVQQGSTVITGGLVATALVVYSWTVYLDKTVARSFHQLETLKASIQQVTTVNATLKNSMAEQAESPASGFKPFDPERVIFVAPAPARPSVELSVEPEVQAPMPHPLGY
ncbi:MAG: hypothetical protein AAGF93_06160 [Cyanobacteria bacterium P01_H01_bin.105]